MINHYLHLLHQHGYMPLKRLRQYILFMDTPDNMAPIADWRGLLCPTRQ